MSAIKDSMLNIKNALRALPHANLYLLPDVPRFTILELSDKYAEETRCRRKELIGRGVFEVFSENRNSLFLVDETKLWFSLIKVMEEKFSHEMEVQQRSILNAGTGNVETHYWRPLNTPVLNKEGSIDFIIHSLADVTDSMLLEQKEEKSKDLLKRSEQYYQSLFQQNPDAVFSFDLEGNFLSANNASAHLAECSLEEICRMSFIPFVAAEDLEKTLFYFSEAAKGNPQRYDIEMVTAKGNSRVISVTNLPIIIDNEIVGVYGIAKDITDLMATRKKLVKSNKRFEMVSRVSNDAIWDWNLVTNEISRVESGFYNLFGYSIHDFPSVETWRGLIHPEDVARVLSNFQNSLSSPDVYITEETYRVLKANGEYAYILDRSYIDRDETGAAIHIYGAISDVSKIKNSEKEQQALIKELTQSNLDLRQFSYTVSHNLRTPIGNLISLGNLIDESRIGDPLTKLLFEKYKQTTLKLNENVNDLLEVLIIKNNRELPVKEIDIEKVFQEVAESVNNLIEESGASIRTNFKEGCSIVFNPGYLHSILLNLLANALKYRSPERKLQIEVFTECLNNQVHLIFSDNGLGIDMEKYGERVFGLYQKFHDHPESKGLGLHIVASQVKAMGGEIKLTSELNKGTTFTIKFKN